MTWNLDWPSFIVGVVATWAGGCAIAVLFTRPWRPTGEQLPAVPRWAEPDALDLELRQLLDEAGPAA